MIGIDLSSYLQLKQCIVLLPGRHRMSSEQQVQS